MKNYVKRLIALLVTLVMVLGLFPTAAFAETPAGSDSSEEVHVFTAEDNAILDEDVFARIEAVKSETSRTSGVSIGTMTEADYVAMLPQVIEAVESSETYVPGTLQQNGSFLVWQTTVGMPCCFSPRMEAELHNTQNDPSPEQAAQIEAEAEALLELVSEPMGGGAISPDIGLIQPYWESSSSYADSSFLNYSPAYKTMWQNLYTTTGGAGVRYSMTNANVDNIAATMARCGLVIWDSHGTTDYESGYDYTSRANSSYLCLTTNAGVTSADTAPQTGNFGTYYHAITGSGYAYVDGTCIANHMNSNAPHSLLYMGICLGMATAGLHAPLRAKGVEVAYGYSQSVTFVGEKAYMQNILGHVREGDTFAAAVKKAKESLGPWDSYSSYPTIGQARANYAAFPITVSSEDPYPGQGNVDDLQTVYSSWILQGETFEINAVPNNADWGSVSVLGYTVTAAPSVGYYTVDAVVTEGEATITRTGTNTFYVEPTTDCAVQVNFAAKTPATVTYVSSGTEVGTADTYVGDDVILPSEVTEVPEWTFVGWATDHISVTTDKPVFYKPGTSYTVTSENVTLFAVYKHVEGNGGLCYRLVTEAPDDWEGRYVISSGKNASMTVMQGVAGDDRIESTGSCNASFSGTGITLDDDLLRDVDELYIFNVEKHGSAYSFQNADKGTYLSIDSMYLWVHTNYSSSYANWNLTANANGVVMKVTGGDSYPYLAFSSGKFVAASSSSSTVQLWQEISDGTSYYWTDPVVEPHEHQMTAYPEVAPTCATDGNIAYWRCSVCYKYFSDEAGENEITLESTVLPATGAHTFGDWVSNNNGTHKHTCTVCGLTTSENCTYEETVTPPTPLEQGFTTHTCTVCSYSYSDSFTPALGLDYTVSFSVPDGCVQPAEMISNTNTGITLPTVAAPEGYKFLGWVETPCDNAQTRPEGILTGHYVASSDITLYALFRYFVEDGTGVYGFELVTEAPEDWTGRYVVTYKKDNGLYLLTGIDAGSYESASSGGSTAFADAGVQLSNTLLTKVDDLYVFEVEEQGSGWSIRNMEKGTFLQNKNGVIKAVASYSANNCNWTLTPGDNSSVVIRNTGVNSYPYVNYNASKNFFWAASKADRNIHLWRENVAGTYYWTTDIVETDLVDLYFVDQDDNAEVYLYASGDGTENAPFPGVLATAQGVDENGDNWYKLTLDRMVYSGVIFSDGTAANQIALTDLGENRAIVYYISGGAASLGTDLWPAPPAEVAATCTEAGSVTYTGLLTGVTHVTQIPALGHDFGAWTETTAPTCTADGEQTRTCSRCDAAETQPVSALGHNLTDHEAQTPTCTEVGWNAYQTCSRCDYTTYEELPALGHDLTDHEAQVPNCTEIGWNAYQTCSRCDYTTYEELPALGHDLTDHEGQTPTCTAIGWNAYQTCSRCDYTTYEELAALGHDLIDHEAQTPTCTEIGWNAYQNCSRCDYTTYEELAALGHDLIDHEAQAPTCTDVGWDAYQSCSRCDYTTYTEIPALEHELIHHEAKAPTCTEIGWDAYDTCAKCDYTTYAELPALGHDLTDHEAKAPTCTEIGWNAYQTCSRCDYTTYAELAALGHDLTDHEAKTPTCTEIGWNAYQSCSRCDYTTYAELAALGHQLTHYVAKAPTCTEVGWNAYQTCARCDYTTYAELPALGHDLTDHEAKAPTCTEIGWNAYQTCSRCSYTTYAELAALGHDPVEHEAKAPTCTEVGWNAYQTCSRCDYTTYKEIAALGHQFMNNAAKAPTCTEVGWNAYQSCTRCDYTTYEELAALGHVLVDHEAKAPTCTEIGWNAYQTCSRCDYTSYAELPALGHTPADPAEENRTEPDCTTAGSYDTVIRCTVCEAIISSEHTELPALGHAWEEPEYVWSEDDAQVTATRVCANDPSHTETETAQTVSEITVEPTNSADGEIKYTATFTNPAFAEQTKTAVLPKLSPTLPCDGDSCPGKVFTDMPAKENWAHDAIDWAVVQNITTGTDETTFSPAAACTRGQIVTFLYRAAGSPEPQTANNPFVDVKASSYCYKAVLWAAETGITTGTSDNAFSPNDACTREQVATFLWRFAGSPEPEAQTCPFGDVKTGSFSYKAILWAAETGITTGTSDNAFSPKQTCTRAQIVTFLWRYMTK